MKHIYVAAAAIAVLLAAWGAGKRVGTAQCREQVAAQNQILHIQTIQKQGEINAETLRRGTDDIRSVLRTQYTIAE